MGEHKVTLIPGDGIGPEVARAARLCLEATGVKFQWDVKEAGQEALKNKGTPLPEDLLHSIRENGAALKGPVTTPVAGGFRSVNVGLRQRLDLYAGLRPAKTIPGVLSRYQNVDLVIMRENTEDVYAGIEFGLGEPEAQDLRAFIQEKRGRSLPEDSTISIKPISTRASERIVRFAFDYARQNHRHKVTAVHKANVMKATDGLFLNAARKVAEAYPDIEFEDRMIDDMCHQLVRRPEHYDVLVLPNLYGDIVSDLSAGLVGSLGLAYGANIGDDCAVFEAVHGTAPRYAGQNKVNPAALILSGVLLLRYLGEEEAAQRLQKAVYKVIAAGEKVTYDLKPSRDDPRAVGTQEMAQAIVDALEE
ncbi:MAG: isocitrate dehydrogenase [Planctomycetes bacterium DG_23]|nr:MAG: isocitrate dehydrogenase [Planctomycetes bacterium DG_23]